MKIFGLFALFFIMALPVQAATPITREAANAYYDQCMQGQAPGLTEQTKSVMCSCTAAAMMMNMNVEDVQAMSNQDQSGRNALNKMIIGVYAPCMQYPARDHYYSTCINNPDTAKMGGNTQQLCTCLADNVAQYLDQNSQKVFQDILTRTPNIVDPMQALTSDPQFQQFAQSRLLACVAR